ncbi:hypothetical protein ACQ4PT_008586 [Festuca glaucescens]
MAAVVGAAAVEDTVVAAAVAGDMEVVAVAEGMAVVVGEEVEEEATAVAAAGEVAGAGEDAKATGSALTRALFMLRRLSFVESVRLRILSSCYSCGNVNFARRTECNKCGSANPSGGGGGGGGYDRSGGGYNRGGGDHGSGGGGGYSRGDGGRGGYNRDGGSGRGFDDHRGGSGGRDQENYQRVEKNTYNDGGYGQAPPKGPPSYGGPAGDYAPPPSSYGGSNVYSSDTAVPPPNSYGGGRGSYPPSYGAPPQNSYSGGAPGGQGGLPPTYDGGYGGRSVPGSGGAGGAPPPYHGGGGGGGYTGNATPEPATKVKQCDANCDDSCDNPRIYISNLPPDVTVEELQELFGGIGQVGRIKQKRGYKDQWPWNIKIYADDSGKNKGDACLAYEDPSAAHAAGGFYNNYDMRGHKISVVMAEKSAPRAPTSGHGGGRGGGGGYGGDRRRDGGGHGPNRNQGGGSRSRPY